jgi:hypothetical protein
MAAPSPNTTERTPSGTKLDDGYQTLIVIDQSAAGTDWGDTIAFWEKTVTPPGLDGLEPIDTTTMYNTTYRTFAQRALVTMTDLTVTAAYDPKLYTDIVNLLNEHATITVLFPDGSNVCFFGFLRSFTPGEHVEGSQPEATIVISPLNQDTSGDEYGPVYAAS